MSLIRAIIDTNLFVSGVIKPLNTPARVLHAWQRGEFVLVTCTLQRDEVVEVLQRPYIAEKYSVSTAAIDAIVARLMTESEVVAPAEVPAGWLRDPDDEFLVGAAIAGLCDVIVTGDHDLHAVAGDPELNGIAVASASEFLRALGQGTATGR